MDEGSRLRGHEGYGVCVDAGRRHVRSRPLRKICPHPHGWGRILVPVTGIEPVRVLPHGILSPGRLPVPPHRRSERGYFTTISEERQELSGKETPASGWRRASDCRKTC